MTLLWPWSAYGCYDKWFKKSCLQSHQQWRSVPLSLHPRQHLLSPEFLMLVILTGVRWNLRVVLICIAMMTKDIEHFFRCFSVLQVSSVENSLFSSVPHFLIGLFGSLESNFLSSLYILDISPLSIRCRIGKDLFPNLLVASLSCWQCPLLYKSFAI